MPKLTKKQSAAKRIIATLEEHYKQTYGIKKLAKNWLIPGKYSAVILYEDIGGEFNTRKKLPIEYEVKFNSIRKSNSIEINIPTISYLKDCPTSSVILDKVDNLQIKVNSEFLYDILVLLGEDSTVYANAKSPIKEPIYIKSSKGEAILSTIIDK